MPWVPLADSGLVYEFMPDGLDELEGSVAVSVGSDTEFSGWTIQFDIEAEIRVRLTVQAWAFPGAAENPHYFTWDTAPSGAGTTIENSSGNPELSFVPSELEATILEPGDFSRLRFYVDGYAPGLAIEALVEVFVEGPDCFWRDIVNATQVCADAPVTDIRNVELFSAYTGSSGVYIPIGELSNGLLLTGAEAVQITGYFTPRISAVVPERDETTPVDVVALTYTPITPHVLTYDGGMSRYGNGSLISGAPNGWFYATVEVDGLEVLANVLHHGGF